MKIYNKKDAIVRMNEWAKANVPFIFIIDYMQENVMLEKVDDVDASECLFSFNTLTNASSDSYKKVDKENILWKSIMPQLESYRKGFDIVVDNIMRGNSYLINLTCKVPVETNLTFVDIFHNSKAMYKLYIKDKFVCFSPEIFVRIEEDGIISSYPMKGTVNATLKNAEELLMNDEKEAAEHATIVDLIRNDLSMVSDGVKVDKYRYVDTIQTNKGPILQTSSKISGHLPIDYAERIGDIIFTLLPAGSITGAPKKKTMEIIVQAEGYDRNFYTGIMGYYKDKVLDSAVMIRFIEQENGKLFFKAGGGITSKSCCESEYNEVKQKIYVPIY